MATMGVPLYNAVLTAESNAMPCEMQGLALTSTSNDAINGRMGNIMAFEMWHWGAKPSVRDIGQILTGAGLVIATYIIYDIAQQISTFLNDGGALTAYAIASIIWMSVAGYLTWPVLVGIAAAVVMA